MYNRPQYGIFELKEELQMDNANLAQRRIPLLKYAISHSHRICLKIVDVTFTPEGGDIKSLWENLS